MAGASCEGFLALDNNSSTVGFDLILRVVMVTFSCYKVQREKQELKLKGFLPKEQFYDFNAKNRKAISLGRD
jgi:hypothetical protein